MEILEGKYTHVVTVWQMASEFAVMTYHIKSFILASFCSEKDSFFCLCKGFAVFVRALSGLCKAWKDREWNVLILKNGGIERTRQVSDCHFLGFIFWKMGPFLIFGKLGKTATIVETY